jgi:hypothetical protein
MGCPKNWVPGTFEKLEVPLCSELPGDSGNAIKKFFSSEVRVTYILRGGVGEIFGSKKKVAL